MWGKATSVRSLVLCTVCCNFQFPPFSIVWMGHVSFSCLESATKASPFFFRFSFLGSFPQHPSLSLLWIGQLGTCVLHYLPLHSVFLFRIGHIGPSFPQLTLYSPFTNLTSLLFSGSSVFSFFVSSFLHAGRHGWNTDCAAVLNFDAALIHLRDGTTNWLRLFVLAFRWILVGYLRFPESW